MPHRDDDIGAVQMTEFWKPYPLKPNYLISNYGRVFNIDRGNQLKLYLRKEYPSFTFNIGGVRKNTYVHRAVALTHLDLPCPSFLRKELWEQFTYKEKFDFYYTHGDIDHIDRNRQNAKASNLRWTTPSDNFKNTNMYESYNVI